MQLALFFDQVKIRSYPKKSISFLIAAFFVIVISSDLTVNLQDYVDVNKQGVWWYVILWLRNIIQQVMYLTITGAFLYLADFGYEKRTDQGKP